MICAERQCSPDPPTSSAAPFSNLTEANLARSVRENSIQHAANFETGLAGSFKFLDAQPGHAVAHEIGGLAAA